MDVQDYLRLPYHIGMIRSETADGDAGWVSWVEELEGCISQGDTPAEAASMIYEAMELWIETVLEGGGAVPFPRPEPAHSGRFQVRLPSSLHTALSERRSARAWSTSATRSRRRPGWESARESRRANLGTAKRRRSGRGRRWPASGGTSSRTSLYLSTW